jgi:hypothetical protein
VLEKPAVVRLGSRDEDSIVVSRGKLVSGLAEITHVLWLLSSCCCFNSSATRFLIVWTPELILQAADGLQQPYQRSGSDAVSLHIAPGPLIGYG